MFGLGTVELVFILLVVFLLFGPKAFPEIIKNICNVVKMVRGEFNQVSKGLRDIPDNLDDSNDFKPTDKSSDWRASINKSSNLL